MSCDDAQAKSSSSTTAPIANGSMGLDTLISGLNTRPSEVNALFQVRPAALISRCQPQAL